MCQHISLEYRCGHYFHTEIACTAKTNTSNGKRALLKKLFSTPCVQKTVFEKHGTKCSTCSRASQVKRLQKMFGEVKNGSSTTESSASFPENDNVMPGLRRGLVPNDFPDFGGSSASLASTRSSIRTADGPLMEEEPRFQEPIILRTEIGCPHRPNTGGWPETNVQRGRPIYCKFLTDDQLDRMWTLRPNTGLWDGIDMQPH